jgi:uncharacterized alkaline shock family protein YloU
VKITTKLKIYLNAIIFFLIGILLLSLAIGFINAYEVIAFLDIMNTWNVRLAMGLTGALLLLISFIYEQAMFGRIRREKNISFQTASGEVLVSLHAVEDLIRKVTIETEGIKEARPDIVANKKGIEINLRLVLNAEVNIPEFTDRIQGMIKARIQEMLGIDEEIVIRIFVAKIISREERMRKRREKESESEETPVPFQGYKR